MIVTVVVVAIAVAVVVAVAFAVVVVVVKASVIHVFVFVIAVVVVAATTVVLFFKVRLHYVKSISCNLQGELLLELHYSDPRDSKVYSQPGGLGAAASNSNKSKVDGSNSNLVNGEEEEEELIYKLYVGGEYYYCRPYRPNYEAVRSKNGEFCH